MQSFLPATAIPVFRSMSAAHTVNEEQRSREDRMHTLILFAVLHGYISIPPIRTFQPYPDVKCPAGYSIWWPQGKEFENDRFAQCIKPLHPANSGVVKNVSLRSKTGAKNNPVVKHP